MKQYRITLKGHTFDVKVLDDPRRGQVRVEVDGEVFTVGVEAVPAVADRLPKSPETLEVLQVPHDGPPKPVETPEVSGNTVAAPLPGVVKSIAVRHGQRVAADDVLLVIEAMKMDNVIRAPDEGTIGAIYATEGRQVAYGEPLLEMNNEQ